MPIPPGSEEGEKWYILGEDRPFPAICLVSHFCLRLGLSIFLDSGKLPFTSSGELSRPLPE